MTDLSVAKKLSPYKPKNKVRFVTATSLFDGHDASINIMRRILQSTGSEVIHLGHNRSVQEIVNAALQEDAQGICITSYQGGHVEFFKYMIDLLRAGGGENIKVFGGGGGVIVPSEIKELHAYGVTRIYAPEDGVHMGLQGMINEVVQNADYSLDGEACRAGTRCWPACRPATGASWRASSPLLENGVAPATERAAFEGCSGVDRARSRHYRHRRCRQVVADRRNRPPLPSRSGRQRQDRAGLHRPVAQAHRRRAARRPYPHERDRASEHLSCVRWPPAIPAAKFPLRCPK